MKTIKIAVGLIAAAALAVSVAAAQQSPGADAQAAELLDLSEAWQYPSADKWGDKTSVTTEGNKIHIKYTPGPKGGWGWAGGAISSVITPVNGSQMYFKGTGEFKLKLEQADKRSVSFNVTLKGMNTWTRVPLGNAQGRTFSAMVLDGISGNIIIAERFYSQDGSAPADPAPVTPASQNTRQVQNAAPNLSPAQPATDAADLKAVYITLKLEGSETVTRSVNLRNAPVSITDLPAGLVISRIVIDKIMPGQTVEIDSMTIVRSGAAPGAR